MAHPIGGKQSARFAELCTVARKALSNQPRNPGFAGALNGGQKMKAKVIFAGVLATGFFFGAANSAAQSLNPIHWIKKSPTATEQLAANQDENKKLALQLQAILPPRTSLNDACLAFKSLNDCVAALHVSHNLKIRFTCLKWQVTAVQSSGTASACKAPERGRPVNLVKAIRLLKPDADAKTEAKTAEKRAHDDIKDASS